MTLSVEVRSVYGTQTIYPLNHEAKTFAAIAGTKTLTQETIRLAKSIGCEIKIVQPEVSI